MSAALASQTSSGVAKSPPVGKANLVLQRKCACGSSASLSSECEECGKKKLGLQLKFAIGAASDPLEREADRVADQVTSGASPNAFLAAQHFGEANVRHQMHAPASVHRVLGSSGMPLSSPLRREMERWFGHDLSRVRVHADAEANRSARDIGARSYTSGTHIVFSAGSYRPGTAAGRHLLAHELTHVLQQRGGASDIQRQADGEGEAAGETSTLDSVLGALETASVVVPGLDSVVRTVRLVQAVTFFWEHRDEHLQALLDSVGASIATVPTLAGTKLDEFLAAAGTGRDAGACVGEQLILLLDSLAENWRATLGSFVRDFFFVGLFERAIPTIIEQSELLFRDILDGEFRSAIDRSVAIMTEINSIAGVLYLWYALIATVIGAVAGSEAPVAGNAVGAAAGLTLSQVVNVALIASVVATETTRIGRGIDDMIRFWDDIEARERACREVAEGVFALTLTGVLFYFGPQVQRFARSIISQAAVEVRAVVTAVTRDTAALAEGVRAPQLVTPEGFRFAGPEPAAPPSPAQRGPAPARPSGQPVVEPPTAARRAPRRGARPSPAPEAAPQAARGRATGAEPLAENPARRTEGSEENNSMRHQIQRGDTHYASRAVTAPPSVGVTAFQLRETMAANFERYMRIARREEDPPRGWTRGPVDWAAPIRSAIIAQSQAITGIVAAGGVRIGGDVNALRRCFDPSTLAPSPRCASRDVRLDIENRGHNLRT